MFEKLSQAAEQLATGASRRQFLGRFGGAAAALAAAVGALLALPARAAGGNTVCDPDHSESQCAGVLEGTMCFRDDGKRGRCRRASGPTGKTGCYCKGFGQ